MSMPIQRQSEQFAAFDDGPRFARDKGSHDLPKGLAGLINTSGPRIQGGLLNTREAVNTQGMNPDDHAYGRQTHNPLFGEYGHDGYDYEGVSPSRFKRDMRDRDLAQEIADAKEAEDDASGYNWGPVPPEHFGSRLPFDHAAAARLASDEERQQSRDKAKELADGLWNAFFPPEEEEGRIAVQNMDTVNNFMNNGWQPEHIKYDEDGQPYAHYEHPSGWTVTDRGGMYKDIGHVATPGEAHDVINVSRYDRDTGESHNDLFGPQDAHNFIEEQLHGDPEETGGTLHYLMKNDPRIRRYKPRQAAIGEWVEPNDDPESPYYRGRDYAGLWVGASPGWGTFPGYMIGTLPEYRISEEGLPTQDRMSSRRQAKGECECWEGYERVPGTKPCAEGSCRKCDSHRKTAAGLGGWFGLEIDPHGEGYDPDDFFLDKARKTYCTMCHRPRHRPSGPFCNHGDGGWKPGHEASRRFLAFDWIPNINENDLEMHRAPLENGHEIHVWRYHGPSATKEDGSPEGWSWAIADPSRMPDGGKQWSPDIWGPGEVYDSYVAVGGDDSNNHQRYTDNVVHNNHIPTLDEAKQQAEAHYQTMFPMGSDTGHRMPTRDSGVDYDELINGPKRLPEDDDFGDIFGKEARLAQLSYDEVMKRIDEQLAAGEPEDKSDHSTDYWVNHDPSLLDDPEGDRMNDEAYREYQEEMLKDRHHADWLNQLSGRHMRWLEETRDPAMIKDFENYFNHHAKGGPAYSPTPIPESELQRQYQAYGPQHNAALMAPPVVGAHGFQPAHRVGLPWRDSIIPGTVIGLDGPNVAVRWDDGQYSTEEPHNIQLL